MYCSECGKELKPKVMFCPNCGVRIEPEKWMEDLVIRAQHNDISAWEEIYKMTSQKAYAVAFQIVKNEQEAQDMLQDTYVSAIKNIGSLQDPAKLAAWINRITANQCKNWLKKKKRIVLPGDAGEDESVGFEDRQENENVEFMPEESVDYAETKRLMQEILDKLSDEQRLCVLMYYYDEVSVGEIAETLECSTGTIKSRLNYARKYIKAEVEALEKKGTRLYNITPIPFIIWMLRSEEASHAAEVSEAKVWDALRAVMEAVPAGATGAAGSSAAMSGVTETAAQTAAGAATTAAGHTASWAAGAGLKHVAVRITVGIVAAASLAAGGSVVYHRMHPVVAVKDSRPKPTKEELQDLRDKIDYAYLESLCSYLPEYDSAKDIPEKELNQIYEDAFAYCFEANYDEQYHTGDDQHAATYSFTNREIIPLEQIVDEKDQTVTFKASALDMFDQMTGITTDPKSVKSDLVKYDGKEYKGTFKEPKDNNCITHVIYREIDEENGSVQVFVEKKDTDPETSEVTVTKETVTIVLSDNEQGYRIRSIKEGYSDKVDKVQSIAESLNEDSDDVMLIVSAIGDFSEDSEDVSEAMDRLVYRVAMQYGEEIASDVEEYGYATQMNVDRTIMDKYFELAGIASDYYENGVNSDTVTTTGDTYQVYTGYLRTDSNVNIFLRTEVDPDKGEVYLYYIGYHREPGEGYNDFRKGTVTLISDDNDYGYKIKNIVTTAWNDEYAQEMYEMEQTVAEDILRMDAHGIIEGGEDATKRENAFYEDEMQSVLSRAKDKYPTVRLTIERNQAQAEKQMNEEAAEIAEQYGMTAEDEISGFMSKRIFYLVGNLLMDDHIEALE